eukprot:768657-Hanusia_phi.AAC.13
MSFNIELDSDNEEVYIKPDLGFEFKLPKTESKNINIVNDNILFNKANISQDILSMSSKSNSDTGSIADEREFKFSNMSSDSTDSERSSKSSIIIQKAKPKNNVTNDLAEKREILYQFDRMKSKGHNVPFDFNMTSDLNEMRLAFDRIKHERDIDGSVRFQRRMLMSFVTALEYLNDRYDPFAVELNGWSESVYDTLDDYDDIFEELHDKYKDTGSGAAPEVRLMLSLGGSAFMFNLTKKMFNTSKIPDVEDILKSNPELMKQFKQASANHYMNDNFGVPMPQMSQPRKEQPKQDNSIFGMMSGLFNGITDTNLDVDNIIQTVHHNINIVPDQNDIEETLTVTDDDLSQILDNITEDSSKPIRVKRKTGGRKKVLDL